MMQNHLKVHNGIKMIIDSRKQYLLRGSKTVKVNVMGTVSQTAVIGPQNYKPPLSVSAISDYSGPQTQWERRFSFSLPFHFLSAKHLLWLPMNQVLLPLFPCKLMLQVNVTNLVEAPPFPGWTCKQKARAPFFTGKLTHKAYWTL